MKNDVAKYIDRRKRADKAFAGDFDAGYEKFKIGVMLREAREQAGVTQEELAQITRTKKVGDLTLGKPRGGRAPVHRVPRGAGAGQGRAD